MRRWLRIWAGHFGGGLAAVLFLFGGYFMWRAARGTDGQVIMWNFTVAGLLILLSLVVLALAVALYYSPTERWYARNQRRLAEAVLSPAGAPRHGRPLLHPKRKVYARHAARVAGQKDI